MESKHKSTLHPKLKYIAIDPNPGQKIFIYFI